MVFCRYGTAETGETDYTAQGEILAGGLVADATTQMRMAQFQCFGLAIPWIHAGRNK
jgi:hypothetical protein